MRQGNSTSSAAKLRRESNMSKLRQLTDTNEDEADTGGYSAVRRKHPDVIQEEQEAKAAAEDIGNNIRAVVKTYGPTKNQLDVINVALKSNELPRCDSIKLFLFVFQTPSRVAATFFPPTP